MNVTYDFENYFQESIEILSGTYFFYDSNRVEHSRDVMTYWGVLGEFVGIQAQMLSFFGFFAQFVNDKLKNIKFVTLLFHKRKNKN